MTSKQTMTPKSLAERLWNDRGEVRVETLELLSHGLAQDDRYDFVADMLDLISDLEARGLGREEIADAILSETAQEEPQTPRRSGRRRPLLAAALAGYALAAGLVGAAVYGSVQAAALAGKLMGASKVPGQEHLLRMTFADSHEDTLAFASPISTPLPFTADGAQLVAVGTGASGEEPSRLIVFRSDCASDRVFEDVLTDTPPWGHQEFNKRCHVKACIASDFDGDGRPELFVVVTHDDGPMEMITYDTKTWSRLSEGWHYGHMFDVFLRDVNGDGLPEVVLVGVANERNAEWLAGAKEPLRAAIMIIDPLRRQPWAWSMNGWMNDPAMAPLAYGVVTESSGHLQLGPALEN